jgi:WD40-like Beta Propeller Repeat
MDDLRTRLRAVDSVSAPADWPDLETRAPSEPSPEPRGRRVLAGVVAAVVFAAGASLAVWAFRRSPSRIGSTGLNGQIAFVRGPGFGMGMAGSVWIYAVQPDGSGLHRVVAGAQPSWSPDGTHLAYVAPEPRGIRVVDAGGQRGRQLTFCEGACGAGVFPAWSPDGTRIAFVRSVRHRDTPEMVGLYVMNADGSRLRQLVGCESSATCGAIAPPAWSPDGQRIVFATVVPDAGHSAAQVRILDLSTGQVTPIYTCLSCYAVPSPAWSPTGDAIALDVNRSIYTMRLDGSDLTRLTNCGTPVSGCADSNPVWSPDGTAIAFARGSYLPLSRPQVIEVMQADGSGLHGLTHPPAGEGDLSPAWATSPVAR